MLRTMECLGYNLIRIWTFTTVWAPHDHRGFKVEGRTDPIATPARWEGTKFHKRFWRHFLPPDTVFHFEIELPEMWKIYVTFINTSVTGETRPPTMAFPLDPTRGLLSFWPILSVPLFAQIPDLSAPDDCRRKAIAGRADKQSVGMKASMFCRHSTENTRRRLRRDVMLR